MPFFRRGKDFITAFMSISIGVRLLLGAVLAALGSSTLIGFLAELGAVNYALAYGARIPTEGVPYLRYAATAISLAMFLIALAILFVLNLTIVGAIRQFMHMPLTATQAEWESIGSIPIRKYVLKGALPAFVATQGLTQLFYLAMPLKTTQQWVFPVFALAATLLILVLARNPTWTKWLILSTFMFSVSVFFVAAFTPSVYGMALNFARLGGGVPIRLELNCEGKTPCASEVTGKLFLRTTESFLLRDEITQEYREVPSRLVESVRYVGVERWGTK